MTNDPIYHITNCINNYKLKNDNFIVDEFIKYIYKKYSIMTKYYEEDRLLLLYYKYELPIKTPIAQECRSLVLDITNLQIIAYTCPIPILNYDAQQFLLNNPDIQMDIYKCYEGTILSLFNNNNKWYLSTRRCLYSKLSLWNNSNYYDMFIDVLTKENITYEEFTNRLNPNCGYYFILIHYNNKMTIDYTNQYGENYTKLCLISVKSKINQIELSESEYNFNNYNHIFKSERITMEEFAVLNHKLNINITLEGIIIKTHIENTTFLLKLQTLSYQFCKAKGSESNIYKGYIYLYQNDILSSYIKDNKNHKNLEKKQNKGIESNNIINMVSSVFKLLSYELFELYKLLWSLISHNHLNKELYTILPKEYKFILYKLRGIYFNLNYKNKTFGINNIYKYLKTIDTEHICSLLRQRQILNTFDSITDQSIINLLKSISKENDSQYKLAKLFINKLYPDL